MIFHAKNAGGGMVGQLFLPSEMYKNFLWLQLWENKIKIYFLTYAKC